MLWKVVLGAQILKFQVYETFILSQFIKVPSVSLYNEIYLTKLKFEPFLVQFIWEISTLCPLESEL
jgi:hypothetical protein